MRRLALVAVVVLAALPARAQAPSPSPAPTEVPAGGACTTDEQCVVGTICTNKICTLLPKRRRIIPFYWHQGGDVGYHYITPGLYFHDWGRTGSTRVQVPGVIITENYKEKSKTIIAPAIPPLVVYHKSRASSWVVFPLLLSGLRRDTDKDLTEGLFALLGYYKRERDVKLRVVFPLFFDRETKDSRWTLAPFAWFKRTPTKSAGVIFPLFWRFSDTEQGTSHILFLPFFDYHGAKHGKLQRVVSLLGGYERDDEAGTRQLVWLAPPIFWRKDPLRTVGVVPPLAAWWKVHEDRASGFVAGPLFHSSDLGGATSGLFPLYFRFHDKKANASTNLVPPLFGFHSRPGTRWGYFGPVYGWSSTGNWGGGLFPLALFGKSPAGAYAQVGPVYYKKTADGWDAGLFPIVFAGKHGENNYGFVPPLFFHSKSGDDTTDVVGPLYVKRGKRGWAAGLAPIFFFGNRDGKSHQVIAPLFFRFAEADRERMLIGPFYHARDGQVRTDVLFPLFYLRRAPDHSLMISPLAGFKKDPRGSTVVVGPYVYQSDARKKSSTHFLFPLGAVHRSPGYEVTVQFPFFWRIKEGDETATALFPFYYRIRSPRRQLDGVFPLFVHYKNEAAATTIVGPLWNRTRTDGGRSLGLFPLFAYGSLVKGDKRTRYFGMPGVFWSKNEHSGNTDLVAGPFFDFIRPNGYTAGLIPLAFAWRRGTVSQVVTPIFYRRADSAADSTMNVLGPLYFGHTGAEKKFGLFPLFFARLKPGDNTVALAPLFYFRKKQEGSILATFLFGWSTYATGKRAYVGPFYYRRDSEQSSTALFPIVYFGKNHATGSSTRFLFPFYLDTRNKEGRELQAFTPLVWRYHTVEQSTILGLPLFFDAHYYAESRTTGLLPFFVRHRSEASQSTSWTFPPFLLYARARHAPNDKGTDVVWFPLVWRFGGKDPTTVVAPIFWDFKRGENRTTVLFPIVAFWKRPDAERTIFLNMYYRRGINENEGSWHCHVIPLFSFGRPRKKDIEWDVLLGMFGYRREGRNRFLKLFWLWDVQLEPVPASNLSWFGSTGPEGRTEF